MHILDAHSFNGISSHKTAQSRNMIQVEWTDDDAIVTLADEGSIRAWDRRTGESLSLVPLYGRFATLRGGKGIVGIEGRSLRSWRSRLSRSRVLGPSPSYVYDAAYTDDGRRLVTITYNPDWLETWDAHTGEKIAPALRLQERVNRVRFRSDTSKVVVTHSTSSLSTVEYDLLTGRRRMCNPNAAWGIGVRDGRYALLDGDESSVSDVLATSQRLSILRSQHRNGPRCGDELFIEGEKVGSHRRSSAEPMPPAFRFALGSSPALNGYLKGEVSEVIVYDRILSEQECSVVEGYLADRRSGGPVRDHDALPTGIVARHAAAPGSLLVRHGDAIWSSCVPSGKPMKLSVAFSSVVYSETGRVGSATPTMTFKGPVPGTTGVMSSVLPSGFAVGEATIFALAGLDGEATGEAAIRIEPDASSDRYLRSALGAPGRIRRLSVGSSLMNDGGWIATTPPYSDDAGSIRVDDLMSGRRSLQFSGNFRALAVNRNETLLAAAAAGGQARIFGLSDGKEVATLAADREDVLCLAFSPDGSRLATGGRDRVVRLWDTATWEQVASLPGHDHYVKAVLFSPDGSQLVSCSGDQTARIWDTVPFSERQRRAREDAIRRRSLRPAVLKMMERCGGDPSATADELDRRYPPGSADREHALRILLSVTRK